MQQPSNETLVCSANIEHMQGSAGSQHAPYLMQSLLLLVVTEVMEHEGGQNSVIRPVRVRKLVREAAIELQDDSLTFGFSLRATERLRIGIEADDRYHRMESLDL